MKKYAQRKILFRDTNWLLSNITGSLAICHIGVATIKQSEPAQYAVQHGRSTVSLHCGRATKRYSFFSEIDRRMKVQYGDSCLSQGRVYEWVERFLNGRQNVSDEHRSGRPVSVASETVKQQVEQRIRDSRRVTVDEIAAELT